MAPYGEAIGSAAVAEMLRGAHGVQHRAPRALADQVRVDAGSAETGIVGGDDHVACAQHVPQVPDQPGPVRIQRWRAIRCDARRRVRPSDDIAPAGGRNVIAWAHPTSGVAPDCAPSLYPDRAGLIWNLRDMLSAGYVVVATDYPGLGTAGIHPYLIGESAGRAVLDSVRAAQHFSNSGASNRFAVWGHSEGGHAALFTGQLAARYAPDLKLVGVAAAAPTSLRSGA